jgi:hypothetical protein
MAYELKISVTEKPQIEIGEKLYTVSGNYRNKTIYKSVCPACRDTEKISFTGQDGREYEADCPVCQTRYGVYTDKINRIELHEWKLSEIYVHSMHIEGSTNMTDYKKAKPVRIISIKGFTKSNYKEVTYNLPSYNWYNFDQDVKDIDLDKYSNAEIYFKSKKKAETLMKALIEHDRKKLDEFNKKFGTKYAYPA